jgi:hypothetical protein
MPYYHYAKRPSPNARMSDYDKCNPLLPNALRVSGKLYPLYVFREMPYGRVINKYYRPYNPRTPKQQAWRMYYKKAVYNWQHFNDQTKTYYNKMTWERRQYGYHRYLKRYLLSNR